MLSKRDALGLAALWAVLTAYNLYKPYQIDDGAHLVIARWIMGHPLHPLSGALNWVGAAAPIYETNQPALYFYLLAGWGYVFGFGEVAMHSLQAGLAGLCMLIFYRMARVLAPNVALWLTAMLVLNPAFIVEQNLMVDVPLLGLWLVFFDALLCREGAPHARYGLAGAACAAAVLVKYSSLLLLPILAGSLVMERRWRQAWCLGVPVLALAAWSAFNWFDYGGVHVTTAFHASAKTYLPRAGKDFEFLRKLVKGVIAWAVAVGALCPFGLLRLGLRVAWALAAGLLGLALAVMAGLVPDIWADRLLWLGFVASFLALAWLVPGAWTKRRVILLAWALGTSVFYIGFSPFIAARHVLLIVPALALLAAMKGIMAPARRAGLALTALISLGLCVSDFRFAAFFRDEASVIPRTLPKGAVIWDAGHWGWGYYAAAAGMRALDIDRSRPAPGDYVVMPEEADHQWEPGLSLRWVRTDEGNFSAGDPFCTGRPSRFYLSYVLRGPWSLSADCAQHIDIFEVQGFAPVTDK